PGQVFRAIEVKNFTSYQNDEISFILKARSQKLIDVFQDAEHTDDRGGFDGFYLAVQFGLVVETHISSSHGRFKSAAGFAHPFDDVDKLPIYFLVVGITKIEAIGDGYGLGSAADNVSGSLRYSDHTTDVGIGVYVIGITIHAH